MAKKKAEAQAPEEATSPLGEAPAAPEGNGERRRPVYSLKCPTDRTTVVEVAVWANTVQYQDGGSGTQYGVTLSRSYRDGEGVWHPSTSYRAHDVPVVQLLLTKAYDWAVSQRIDCPF